MLNAKKNCKDFVKKIALTGQKGLSFSQNNSIKRFQRYVFSGNLFIMKDNNHKCWFQQFTIQQVAYHDRKRCFFADEGFAG